MALSSTTTDHDEIKEWIEARGGRPVVVATTHDSEGEGLIRIDFNEPEDRLEEIEWDEFFEIFEKNNLAFLHQDQTAAGEESRFFRFLQREGTDQGDDGRESKTGQGTGSAKVDGKTSKTKSAGAKKKDEGDKPKRAAAKKADDKPKKTAKKDEGADKPKRAAKPKADKPAAKKDDDKPKRAAAKKADDKPAKAVKPKKDEKAKDEKPKAKKDDKPTKPKKAAKKV